MAGLRKIPGEIDLKNYATITRNLDAILKELKSKRTGAKRVVTRLNDSTKSTPKPYFLGIVEDQDLTRVRKQRNEPDAGLLRFADDNPSVVYDQTVNDPAGRIISRNWKNDQAEKSKYTDESVRIHARALGSSVGCDHQRFIAIRIPAGDRHKNVGTITVGFREDPAPHQGKIEEVMKKWAQDADKSPLIKYLVKSFQLNGPSF